MRKILQLLVILSLFFAVYTPSQAQSDNGKISGKVTDKDNNNAIQSATVKLLNSKDSSLVKGTETDANGEFTIANVPYGKYSVLVELTGYSKSYARGITIDGSNTSQTLDLKLKSGTTTTEEIVVESEKSDIELKPDRRVFNVEKNMNVTGGSAVDVLKNIPSVSVDVDGNVTLRGNSNVKIIIDGKPFGMNGSNQNTMLEQIPANQISSVELITNPGAKFDAEGASGIINIVLKKNEGFGYNGSATLNAGTKDKYNGSFNLNVKNKGLNLFGSYDYRLNNFFIEGSSLRDNFLNPAYEFTNQATDGNFRNYSHFGKGGFDYTIDDRNSLSLSGNYNDRRRQRSETGTVIQTSSQNVQTGNYVTSLFEKGDGYSYNLSGNYSLKFKNPKQNLSSDISFLRWTDNFTDNNINNYYINSGIPQTKRNQYNNEVNDEFNWQVDYTHPFSENTKLELGSKEVYRNTDKDFRSEDYNYTTNTFQDNPNLTNRFKYSDNIVSGYLTFSSKINNTSFILGLRGEQTNTDGNLVTNNTTFKTNYFDLFPSASITQKLGTTEELSASYSRRIYRPGTWDLNPFINATDPLNYFSGNPSVKPEYTNSYELSFIKYFSQTTVTPTLFYRDTYDKITRTRTLIDSNRTLTTVDNLDRSKSYGAEFVLNTTLFQFWNINGSVSYFKNEVTSSIPNTAAQNSTYSWSGRATSFMRLPNILDVQISYFYSGKQITTQGSVEPFTSMDVSLKKDFLDNHLSVSFRVQDVFNNLKFKVLLDDPNFTENFFRKRDTRAAFLTLTYKFGKEDKNQKRRKNDSAPPSNDGMGF
ncbi:MAG: TonB-dependent receptor [Bacteroidetes bacterium]|nr:TonB-dependent receptor [Bacteroidota bacterium]